MKIAHDPFLLSKVVCEVRYKQGYRYLDVCGQTLVEIEKSMEGWEAREVQVQSGRLENAGVSMEFVFSAANAALTQNTRLDDEQVAWIEDDEPFKKHAHVLFSKIIDAVQPTAFTRRGIRFIDLRGVEAVPDGLKLLQQSPILRLGQGQAEKILDRRVVGESIVLRAEDETRGTRIGVGVYRRSKSVFTEEFSPEDIAQARMRPPHTEGTGQVEKMKDYAKWRHEIQRDPKIAIVVDLDCYERNEIPKLEIGEFIAWGYEERKRLLTTLFPG